MIARIVNGKRMYLGERIPETIPDRPEIRRYHLWEHLHESDGFAPAVLVDVPGGYALLDETWAKIDGEWVQDGTIVTQAEYDEVQTARRQAGKPDELKEAENAFLAGVAEVNSVLDAGISEADSFQGAMGKIDASPVGDDLQRVKLGLQLRTLWDVVLYHGGEWGDVAYHQDVV